MYKAHSTRNCKSLPLANQYGCILSVFPSQMRHTEKPTSLMAPYGSSWVWHLDRCPNEESLGFCTGKMVWKTWGFFWRHFRMCFPARVFLTQADARALCSSPCPSRQAGRLTLCPCCPLLTVQHLSSPGGNHMPGKNSAPLRQLCHWGGTGQGQPGSPTTSTRGHGLGSPREQGWCLVLCCVPVVEQSPTRDKINREVVHLHLWDRWKGRKQASPQTPEVLWPPATPSGLSWPSLAPAPPGDTVCPCAHPQPSTALITWVSGLKGDLLARLLLWWWHLGFCLNCQEIFELVPLVKHLSNFYVTLLLPCLAPVCRCLIRPIGWMETPLVRETWPQCDDLSIWVLTLCDML